MRLSRRLGLFLGLALAPATVRADVVTDWNDTLLNAIRMESVNPPKASRAMAIVHIAVYDAVNGIEGTHEAYHVTTAAPEGASTEAAAAAAAHRALVALFPNQTATFDTALEASLADIADGASKEDGIEWGEMVADEILALRADDGSADVVAYTPGDQPGDWNPTPPANAASLLPNWPTVTPFAMSSGSQFRQGGPPALDSAEYATACNDVKDFGRVDSSARTEEQTETARFWADGGGTQTPPGHWNTIAKTVATAQGNTVVENARLFALLNIATADAAIVSWDNKYAYDHWRPVTAIPRADEDGNDATTADPDWLPLITTPPFPEYTSGHSTFSGASARILEHFFGTDEVSFSTVSDGLPGVTRSFDSFSEAAAEAGRSRIYGGIHFEYANQDGQRSGRDLADYIDDNLLKAIEDDDGGSGGPRLCGILSIGQFAAMTLMMGALRFAPSRRRHGR